MAKRTAMQLKKKRVGWRNAALNPSATIRVLLEQNPKKAGSRAFAKFAELRTGMTVADYLALEGQRPALDTEKRWPKLELLWCLHMSFIALDDGAVAATTTAPSDAVSDVDELA